MTEQNNEGHETPIYSVKGCKNSRILKLIWDINYISNGRKCV